MISAAVTIQTIIVAAMMFGFIVNGHRNHEQKTQKQETVIIITQPDTLKMSTEGAMLYINGLRDLEKIKLITLSGGIK
jgi:hypothetical protein